MDDMQQINPPFDDSAPCPACQSDLRNVSALIHNFLVRWPEGSSYVKLNDLRQCYPAAIALTVDHPTSRQLLNAAVSLVTACDGMIDEGLKIRWTPEITERVASVVPKAEEAERAFDALSEEHFRDMRHSHGEDNILREWKSTRRIRFLPDKDENFTVEVASDDPDIIHVPCGTGLRIHQHYKDELARDPTFYGKVWCSTCKVNAAWAQFELRLDRDGRRTAETT